MPPLSAVQQPPDLTALLATLQALGPRGADSA